MLIGLIITVVIKLANHSHSVLQRNSYDWPVLELQLLNRINFIICTYTYLLICNTSNISHWSIVIKNINWKRSLNFALQIVSNISPNSMITFSCEKVTCSRFIHICVNQVGIEFVWVLNVYANITPDRAG